jgi:hypothetical protein
LWAGDQTTSKRLQQLEGSTGQMRCLSALASSEYSPCFQFAFCDQASPSGGLGPVLAPRCIRQRPFRMAGERQAVPHLVLALHLEDKLKSLGGFPFLSQPRRSCAAWFAVSPLCMGFIRIFLLFCTNGWWEKCIPRWSFARPKHNK